MLIVYGSLYGSSQRYAEKFSQLTGFPAVSWDKLPDLAPYHRVILFGGLYAGGMTGLRPLLKVLPPDRELMIATVGLGDVSLEATRTTIRRSLASQIPPDRFEKISFFFLRGAIDYKKLSPVHRLLMGLLHFKVSRMPASELNPMSRQFLDTYGKSVNFVDFTALNPILHTLI